MTKIIKRSHWNHFSPPRKPKIPIEPKQYKILSENIYSDSASILLKDLKIPEGYSFNDLSISTEYESCQIHVFLNKQELNKNFEKEFVQYNQDLVKYEQDIINWEKEIIEYDLWKKEYDNDLLKK